MAVVETSQALGEQIKRIRILRRLDQGDLAARVGVERTMITKMESGSRRVSALELVKIAKALDVTVPDLMFLPPEPVRAARTRPDAFQDEASRSEADHLTAELLLDRLLRDADRLREAGGIEPVAGLPQVSGWGDVRAARRMASDVRDFLGVGAGPLGPMVEVGARLGLWLEPIGVDVDGFSATPEPGYGVAVVGGSDPGRRRASAAHEIGHHLSGDSYSADPSIPLSKDERERLIDVFAAELLLPSAVATARMSGLVGEGARDELVRLCSEYRVSWSLGLRVCGASGIDLPPVTTASPTYDDFFRIVGAQPAPDLHPGTMAPSWVQAAYAAARSGYITEARAREIARTSA